MPKLQSLLPLTIILTLSLDANGAEIAIKKRYLGQDTILPSDVRGLRAMALRYPRPGPPSIGF
ncbi:MAG: hypothetical protein GXY55_05640 [Phycisphaerae bacterium]|nr:hypothetical protein [Phycisphaerae bacterium]